MQPTQLQQFTSTIRGLNSPDFGDVESLRNKLRIASDEEVEVVYSPFEHINPQARVVIVGITPGSTQMINALRECQVQLARGADSDTALRQAKLTGAFSGPMRSNLVDLLEHVGVHRWLGVAKAAEFFGSASQLVQTASVLRNPVFFRGANYNGTPNMIKHALLRTQLLDGFGADTKHWRQAVYIPLGDKVAEALHFLAGRGLIDRERILDGIPHPSGANAERIAYFLGRKPREALSAKTNPDKIDEARAHVVAQMLKLSPNR